MWCVLFIKRTENPCTVALTKTISSYIICKRKLENIMYIVVFSAYVRARAAVILLEYCRYGVKQKQPINQIYVIGYYTSSFNRLYLSMIKRDILELHGGLWPFLCIFFLVVLSYTFVCPRDDNPIIDCLRKYAGYLRSLEDSTTIAFNSKYWWFDKIFFKATKTKMHRTVLVGTRYLIYSWFKCTIN